MQAVLDEDDIILRYKYKVKSFIINKKLLELLQKGQFEEAEVYVRKVKNINPNEKIIEKAEKILGKVIEHEKELEKEGYYEYEEGDEEKEGKENVEEYEEEEEIDYDLGTDREGMSEEEKEEDLKENGDDEKGGEGKEEEEEEEEWEEDKDYYENKRKQLEEMAIAFEKQEKELKTGNSHWIP